MAAKNSTRTSTTKAKPRRSMKASERETLRTAEDILRNREISTIDRQVYGKRVGKTLQTLAHEARCDMHSIEDALNEEPNAVFDARTATDLMGVASRALRILMTRLPGVFDRRSANKALELIAELNTRQNMEIRGPNLQSWYWSM